MVKKEKLTQKEQKAQENFLANLSVKKRKTKKPIIVAMVGLVGSGKSSVTKALAPLIGATIIEGDAIRIELRKVGERYESARKIAENSAMEIIKRGGNVIFDSDFIDAKKRASLAVKAKKNRTRVVFLRTYADFDVMAGRIMSATYQNKVGDFFGGASSAWKGDNKGAVVKIREMWRRTPHHYQWDAKAVSRGGAWILKKLPFPIFAAIDTTNAKKWKAEVAKVAKSLLG